MTHALRLSLLVQPPGNIKVDSPDFGALADAFFELAHEGHDVVFVAVHSCEPQRAQALKDALAAMAEGRLV